MPATAPALRVIRLVAAWQKIRQGHVALNGLSCACNLGVGSLSASAFEQPMLDYLHDTHAGTPGVDALFSKCAYVEGEAGSLNTFLIELAQLPTLGTAECTLIGDIERSLTSFAEQHLIEAPSLRDLPQAEALAMT